MPDIWRDSGYHLLRPEAEGGRLAVTDDFLRAYFLRPEVRPVAESCAAEIALHESLTANPREAVSDARLVALEDPDARDNYRVVLDFRDRLLRAGTVEAAYLQVLSEPGGVYSRQYLMHVHAKCIIGSILITLGTWNIPDRLRWACMARLRLKINLDYEIHTDPSPGCIKPGKVPN